MKMEVGFGSGTQPIEINDENLQQVLLPNPVEYERTGADEVAYALRHPIGSPALGEIVKPGEKIVIITSDITRPCPSYVIMPVLLDELYAAGVQKEDITIVFALGSHRKHTEEEKKHLAGERAYSEVKCIDGDADDVVHRLTSSVPSRKRTGGSWSEILSTTTLPVIRAAPKRSCPVCPPGMPYRPTTAG